MYYWYKFITYLLYPFALPYLYIRKLKKKENPQRYKEKISKITLERGEGFLIWFHVASVGEAMSILPLINNYIDDKKINKILITTITFSSSKILGKRFANNSKIVHQFLPLDITFFVSKFLNHWKPNLSIFIDSEIWPNLIFNIKDKKIPLLLINARITKKSFSRWKLVIGFAKKIFSKFDLCITSNKESEKFLETLGAKNIKNYGNLKFSNIKNDIDKSLNLDFIDKLNGRKIWCAASTHPTEEIICAEAHIKVKKYYNNIFTIIIPRHISRSEKIKNDLTKLNLKVVLLSESHQLDSDTDILLVNSYGEALKFYNISRNVFLGKSLVESLIKDSGQNPIEPARFGCKIYHGPNVSNFEEIYKYLKDLNITKVVQNSEDLGLSLAEEFRDNTTKNVKICEKIENYGQNILNNVIIELKKYI